MKSFILSLAFSICCISLTGQEWINVYDELRFKSRMGNEHSSARDTYDNIEGTPFLNDRFVKGSLVTTDSIMFKNVPLRYNIFKDEMEFKFGEGDPPRIIGNPRSFLFFYLEDQTFTYLTFIENNKPGQGYFEVLNQGQCQLLLRRQTAYAEPEKARGYIESRPARFEQRRNAYYLKFGKQLPGAVNLNRRDVLRAFGDKQEEIAGYAKENKLSFRNLEDLIKITRYYNLLIGESAN
jgi:hypothetical protein